MKKSLIYLLIIGLIGIFSSCKKDETRVVMLTNPKAPTITTIPDLALQRTNSANLVTFVGTPVNPGFDASATYFLEACVQGNDFANPLTVWSGVQDTAITMSTLDLNTTLLKLFPGDSTVSADFRIRAVLVVDAGNGAPGTGANTFTYTSAVSNANVRPYGFPRLDLINSGIVQKIESPLANGIYVGFVKLDATKPFTLKDPETGTIYGASSSTVLEVNGTAITPGTTGWYKLTATPGDLTYKLEDFRVGLVGSATPNGWNAPDSKMDFVYSTGTWDITITLVAGDIKFRLNDDWAWNLGGTTDNLTHNGSNYTLASGGNYTFHLKITVDGPPGQEAGSFTFTKN